MDCFWCIEAVFSKVKGVSTVVSGYTREVMLQNPDYKAVYCAGGTGHIEVVRNKLRSQSNITRCFTQRGLDEHDPTTPNRQDPMT